MKTSYVCPKCGLNIENHVCKCGYFNCGTTPCGICPDQELCEDYD